MVPMSDPQRNAPVNPEGQPDRPAIEHEVPGDEGDETWAPSSWDLRQGLDIAELDELPAEWPRDKPR